MNTRLQVEHPVTELVTGLDLVEWQVRVAAGEPLGFAQGDVRPAGHAMEARIYAEDPEHDFLPTGGELLCWSEPDAVRIDSGVASGGVIGSDYDPMLAKVIAHGATRDEALAHLRAALAETVALGVTTNIGFLIDLLDDDAVIKGALDTALVDRFVAGWSPDPVDDEVRRIAAVAARPVAQSGPFRLGDAWRLGGPAPVRVDVDGVPVHIQADEVLPDDVVAMRDGSTVWLHAPGIGNRQLRVTRPIDRRLRATASESAAGTWTARSPMPGAVVAVPVAVGDQVRAGDAVTVVEAMKMEHTLRAVADGVVSDVRVQVGDQVRLDDVLVQVEPEDAS